MNELKAQLIKNMQAELDELKEDLLNISPQEILSRAYEYATKTEIIYAAHDAELDDYQMEALLKHPSPLNDVYSKYLKHDETALSDELANCLAEEANVELHHNENTKEKRHEEYSDAFFIDNGLKRNGIDYEVYANGNFSAEQMQKIRLEMLIAKIIDYIKEKFTQLYQSMKAYANLYMTKLPVEPEEDMSPEDVKDAQLFTLMKRAYDKMNDNYEDFEEMSFDEKVDSIMKEFERVNENERTHTVAKSNELIPEGTEKLEERCFSDRKNISDVVIPGSIREIPYMAFASSSVKTAVIEPGVESISSCAFAATDLESISIPDTVKHIGEQAFAMTDITSIEIPASVKAIGYLAFNGCRNLKEVTMSKGTIFDKDTFPEGVNIRYRENEQEQSEPEEEEGFEPEI